MGIFYAEKHKLIAQAKWKEIERKITYQKSEAEIEILIKTLNTAKKAADQSLHSFSFQQTDDETQKLETMLRHLEQQERIRKLISDVHHNDTQDDLWCQWCLALAQNHSREQATEVIPFIKDDSKKVQALQELGEIYIKDHHKEDALQCWKQAEELLEHFDSNDKHLSRIASDPGASLLQGKQVRQAEQLFKHITDAQYKSKLSGKLGLTYFLEGEEQKAEAKWDEAWKSIADLKEKPKAWSQWALEKIYIQANLLDDAYRIIDTIEQNDVRACALAVLGLAYAQQGDTDLAEKFWCEAEEIIQYYLLSPSYTTRDLANATLNVARTFIQAQKWDRAETIINEINRPDEDVAVVALRELGQELNLASRQSEATRIWQKAEKIIDHMRNQSDKLTALVKLGGAQAKSQRWDDAESTWHKILESIADTQSGNQDNEELLEQKDKWSDRSQLYGETTRTSKRKNQEKRDNRNNHAKPLQQQNRGKNLITPPPS